MNFKYKFDKTNVKVGFDGKTEYSENHANPGQAALFDINLDFLYMAYQMFPPSIKSILNPKSNTVPKQTPREQQTGTSENTVEKEGLIPATGNDIYNYIARYRMANFQIQSVLKLNGKLDQNKLLKAVRLSIEAEPVFGCRFVENQPPYWKPIENIDNIKFCSIEETSNVDEAVKKFLESPLDMDRDPMLKLKLISSDTHDTLCLKINHTACDGTGTKEYLQLLSDIYSHLDQSNEEYVPKPKPRTRADQDRLFNALGIKDPESVGDPLKDIPRTMWPFPWQWGKPDTARIAICKLPEGHVDILSKYAKANGATINDLIVTAFYRAMFEMSQPLFGIPMDLSMTVDLRRYLPDQKTEAIRNFSGGFNTRLARIFNESFEGTLSRVIPMMNKIKKGCPGLLSAVGIERVEKANFHETISFYKDKSKFVTQYSSIIPVCSPVLSNLGVLEKSLFKFGKYVATDAYIIPPALCAPGILLCIGTYNGVITMSVSYYKSQARRDQIDRLLNLIKKELIGICEK